MMLFSVPSRLTVLVFVLASMPLTIFGQTKSAPTTQAPGWDSVWTQPANEQQHQEQEAFQRCEAARKVGHSQEEVAISNRLIQQEPNKAGGFLLRATVFRQLKRYDEALADVAHARVITENSHQPDSTAMVLVVQASLHEYKRDYAAAADDLQAALRLDKNNASAFNSLAWLKATATDGTVRDGQESVRLAQKAVALAPPKDLYTVTDTLAAADAEAGDYLQAVENEKRAMNAADKEIKDAAKAQKFQKGAAERLRLFEQHQPYHADRTTD